MTVTVDVYLGSDYALEALANDVLTGLTKTPKELPPKWFYDDLGSQLFDEITRLSEYYQTRAERSILDTHGRDIARITSADTLIELGSGTSEKTRLLLDALRDAHTLRRFVPFDVSEQTLRNAALAIETEYPGIAVSAIVGDFDHHLAMIPSDGRKLIAFLGGTIGNFAPRQRAHFLNELSNTMQPGDYLLLGTDLVKDPDRLVAAYDDARGVTAAFNKNVLTVMNRELNANFLLEDFDHRAVWDDDQNWIEMRLRARRDVEVKLPALDVIISYARGEEMRTEISAKFSETLVREELAAANLTLTNWWTDEAGDFGVSLATVSSGTPQN